MARKRKINKSNTQIYRNLKKLIHGPLDGPLNGSLKYNLEESDVQTQLCKGKKKANKITKCLVGKSGPIIS